MQDASQAGEKRSLLSTRTMEMVVAALFLVVGAIVMTDSMRIGAGWIDPDGPQAGYFPFRMGAIMSIASVVVLIQAIMAHGPGRTFVDVHALKQVLLVLIPAAVFVVAVNYIGMYVSAAIYIAVFMMYMGGYKWHLSIGIGLAVALVLFFMFDIWFLVPLPKGPLEDMLGF